MNVAPFSLPLADPLQTAAGTIERREGFVVRVEHRGQVGVGEAAPLPGWTESVDECRRALDRASSVTADDDASTALRDLDAADVPAARCGVATALADADARADDEPLYRWLDADRQCDRVPVNATVGDGGPDETASAAKIAIDEGFDCLKVKVGARSVPEDVERMTAVREMIGDAVRETIGDAVRETIGDAVELRADANGAWTREQAERAIEEFAALDVGYVEQPLPAEDLEGHASLRNRGVGIALDEAVVAHDAGAILASDAADVLIVKPMVIGGPGDAYTIAARARERDIEPVVTTTVDGVIARLAAVHVAAALPDVRHCGLATADRLASDLGPDPAPVEEGTIRVPQDGGLGIDPAVIEP